MDLKESWRRDRMREREKAPFVSSRFSQVGGLVRRYQLRETFCRLLRGMTASEAQVLARNCQSDAKAPYQPPLFFLAIPEEYRVIQEILSGWDNPYLAWAHSPEEILLSHFLWQQRPGLEPEDLAHRHFALLLVMS